MSTDETIRKMREDAAAEIESSKKEVHDLAEAEKADAKREAEEAVRDASKVQPDVAPSSSIERKPAETISSQGYDPNSKPLTPATDNHAGANGVPASSNTAQSGHGSGLPRREGVGEQAPDVGKDYGSTPSTNPEYDQTGNGYNPYGQDKTKDKMDGTGEGQEGDSKKGKTGEGTPQEGEPKKGEEKKGEAPLKKDDDPTKKKEGTGEGQEPKAGEKKTPSNEQQNGLVPANNDQKQVPSNQTGNGYGSLDKKKKGGSGTDMSDPTARARRNFNHNNQAKSSNSKPAPKAATKSSGGTKKSGGPSAGGFLKNTLNKAGNGLKNAANKLGNKKDSNKPKNGSDNFMGGLKNAIGSLMIRHPVMTAALAMFVVFILIMAMEEISGGKGSRGSGKRTCTYELSGVTSTGTVELKDLKVELINCDGKADNYEVLATVDFEKYILGVALAEAGPSSPDEALKAQMIAVRNFTLTRNSGMCPSNPSDCFYGYNESTGRIRMRACTNDQVYWDYTKDCPKIDRAGQPTLYCEGVEGATDIWKRALSDSRQQEVEALANEVMGEVLLDENGNVLKLGYQADETETFIAEANAGKSYVEILDMVYGSSDYSSAKCSYGGVYDYGDYELTSDGDPILHQPLDQFLESQGTSLEEYNELIADNVDDAGYGTRAGVVAGSVTMVAELGNNYDVKVPYYWGGGHSNNDLTGEALAKWGSTQCHTYANDQHYNYCGLDCSGFVAWALNAGGFHCGPTGAGSFYKKNGAQKIKLNPNSPVLQPGDILEYKDGSGGHAILVVGIDEDTKEYICIEAMGNAYGVLFTRRSFGLSGYWGVDMEGFYNNPSNLREPRD